MKIKRILYFLLAAVIISAGLPVNMLPCAQAAAKTWVVNTASDENYTQWSTTDNILSLREAIYSASSGDTIFFSEAVQWYNSSNKITLSNGPLEINKNLTIDAGIQYYLKSDSPDVTISANKKSRVINITSGVTVKLCGLAIKDGYINGGTEDKTRGAGIYNAGTLYLNFCTVTDNILIGSSESGFKAYGGGIYSSLGELHISNSEICGNSAVAYDDSDQKSGTAYGGGVFCFNSSLEAYNSSFSDNNATAESVFGSGICINYDMKLENCRIERNHVSDRFYQVQSIYGIGLCINGSGNHTSDITNCLITGNSGAARALIQGAGLYAGRAFATDNFSVNILSTTIAGNEIQRFGDGSYTLSSESTAVHASAVIMLKNSIVLNNTNYHYSAGTAGRYHSIAKSSSGTLKAYALRSTVISVILLKYKKRNNNIF